MTCICTRLLVWRFQTNAWGISGKIGRSDPTYILPASQTELSRWCKVRINMCHASSRGRASWDGGGEWAHATTRCYPVGLTKRPQAFHHKHNSEAKSGRFHKITWKRFNQLPKNKNSRTTSMFRSVISCEWGEKGWARNLIDLSQQTCSQLLRGSWV